MCVHVCEHVQWAVSQGSGEGSREKSNQDESRPPLPPAPMLSKGSTKSNVKGLRKHRTI